MTEAEEKAYRAGQRAALVRVMQDCARQLGYEDPLAKAAALIAEREGAVRELRRLCAEHGDNDWPDDLHLVDVIDKHLGRYLESDDT
jgi:predicted secreted protein